MKVSVAILALVALAVASDIYDFAPNVPRISRKFKLEDQATSTAEPRSIATQFIAQRLPGLNFVIKSHYTTKHNGVAHTYLRQTVNGLEVFNGDANVNVDPKGRVSSFAATPFTGSVFGLATKPAITAHDAINIFSSFMKLDIDRDIEEIIPNLFKGGKISLDDIPARLVYVQNGKGQLELCWHLNIRREDNWFDLAVSTESGEVLALHDWVRSASYNVYPITVNDPDDGPRSTVVDPHLDAPHASPFGWHDQNNGNSFTDTRGNNVYAQENWDGTSQWQNNYRPDAGNRLAFDYPIDFSEQPEEYIDAAVTNLFYWNNIVHDVFYQYGFDEVSGNFQENNFGNGGLGNDAVQANAQDGAGYNNANFATPVDGQRPRMRMYVWTTENPMLDGDLDNGIIIHEYAHGISNRLCGGPANSNCMSLAQSGGMGEGIGDCFSLFLRWRPEYTSNMTFGMGTYAAGEGIRLYDYARDMSINPQTYSYINGIQYGGVHAKGCVWCTIIYDAYLVLIEKYGFDADWYNGSGGNNMFLQNMVDGLKLQPCNPSFVEARDAIIEADTLNYGGRNHCDYWRAFARRGLGVDAVDTNNRVTDSFDVPVECN